jgi:hypothetical protein
MTLAFNCKFIQHNSLQKVTQNSPNLVFSSASSCSEVMIQMETRQPVPQEQIEERKKMQEEELRKLTVQRVKLPNGAIFTRLKPVTVS